MDPTIGIVRRCQRHPGPCAGACVFSRLAVQYRNDYPPHWRVSAMPW